jgi:uncharacterized protein (TIGR00369 family)
MARSRLRPTTERTSTSPPTLTRVTRADDFSALDVDTQERWSHFPHWEGKTYFVNIAGIEVEELRVDYARMTMPLRESNLQAAGLVHGGAIATLIDTVVVPAIGIGLPVGSLWSTIELHVQYHRPLLSDATAEGWVVKRGKSIVFTRAEVMDAEGRHVASGTATYMMKVANS